MNAILRLVSAAVLVSAPFVFTDLLFAQVSKTRDHGVSAGSDAMPELSVAEIEAASAAMDADTGLEQTVKDLLRPKYKQAIETMQQAATFAAQAAGYREAIKTAPERTEALREELESLPSVESAAEVTATGSVKEIQKDLDARRAARNGLSEELVTTTSELALVKARPVEISARLPVAQRELLDIRRQLASPDLAADATSPTRVADRIMLRAAETELIRELEMLEQEQLSLSVRDNLLQARQELLTRQIENATAALNTLDTLAHQRLTSEANRVSSLANMPQDLSEGDDAAQALAVEVRDLATEFKTVVENLKLANDELEAIKARRDSLNEEYELIQEQMALGGGGRAMAQVLFDLDRRMVAASTGGGGAQLPTPAQTRLSSIQAREKLRKQSEVDQRFADHASDTVARLVATRREVLEELRTQYGNLNRSLAVLEGNKRQSLDRSEEVRRYIREQLFWMRSSPPISFQTLTDLPGGIWWTLRGKRWAELAAALLDMVLSWPVVSLAIVLLATTLLFLRGWISAALERTGVNLRRISTDRYAHTSEALLWTFLLAVPVPLLIGYAGWTLARNPEPSDWMRGFRYGLEIVAWITFVTGFLAAVCRPGGLGAAHLGWQQEKLTLFRRALFAFTVVYAPALLLTVSSAYGDASQGPDSVARISFMLALSWTAIVLWRLLRSPNGIRAVRDRERPNLAMTHKQNVWSALLIAWPLALVVLAGAGYVITAFELSIGSFVTGVLIAGGSVLYGLVLRWFMMKQRKLALAEAVERRRARRIAASEEEQEPTGEVVSVDVEEEEELDLDAITKQTRHFLRLLFGLSVAIAVLVFWSRTFPLTEAVDSVLIPLGRGLSLLDVARAILILTITWIAVRNLPGLLELAVLRATTIDAGTRNAITTLCQYAATAVGGGLLLAVLNVEWAQFGWIAAALSVGLGFGLQEVVANFVCGLILLFERPLRVGDIVTVENITGTVTKIHLRATTITNWDREELVVPNKTLITSTLLNLTLSSPLNRILVPVGVAYGSDTEKARQILLEVAADHAVVLDDPPPMASFELLADSSLNLVLRAFLPDRDRRLATITELHTEIVRRFAEAGIEIAFPQQDLHLRSGWDDFRRASSDR